MTWNGTIARDFRSAHCPPAAGRLSRRRTEGRCATHRCATRRCATHRAILARPSGPALAVAFVLVSALLLPCAVVAQDPPGGPTSTFSIVAYDPATGDMGVAVQSKYFAVGAVVPWAEPGVGVVATQAAVNTGYGPKGLQLLREGLSAQQVVERLLAEDTFPRIEGRQLAVVDASGRVAAHTGDEASFWAGHRGGEHFSAQGNILTGPEVADAMAQAYERAGGELAQRLLTALEAGQAAGGDGRGKQSAAIIVIREGAGRGWDSDYYVRLHVDDHATPITELRRLLHMQLALPAMAASRNAVQAGDLEAARAQARRAVELAPGLPDAHLQLGLSLYLSGDREAAATSIRVAAQLPQRYYRFEDLLEAQTREGTPFAAVREDREFMDRILPSSR